MTQAQAPVPDALRVPPPAEHLIPVSRLAPGQSAVVGRIFGRPEDVHRLEEFGLRQGTELQMFRPGNPCILRLAGSKVCLRVDGSLTLLVAPAHAPP